MTKTRAKRNVLIYLITRGYKRGQAFTVGMYIKILKKKGGNLRLEMGAVGSSKSERLSFGRVTMRQGYSRKVPLAVYVSKESNNRTVATSEACTKTVSLSSR
jgi:hypothetical protein